MSYIYMNKDCKFLSISIHQTYSGGRLSADWVERDDAEVFRTGNVKDEMRIRAAGRRFDTLIEGRIISTLKVKVTRVVEILEQV